MSSSSNPPPVSLEALDGVARASWQVLAGRRVYFGHHSVGDGILEGMREIAKGRPWLSLRVADAGAVGGWEEPGIAEGRVGENGDHASKIRDFEKYVTDGPGRRADVAFFKYCYVDFAPSTDAGRLFEMYERSMAALAQRSPRTTFGHITVPLTVQPRDLKSKLKRMAGKLSWEHEANMRREEFNEKLRARYGSTGRVFDLARAESVRPDGTVEAFEWKGARHPVLYPGYAADQGHLGPVGRLVAAREMLLWLTRLSSAGPGA